MRRCLPFGLVAGFALLALFVPTASAGLVETTDAAPLPKPGRTEVGGARWGRYLAVSGGLIQSGGAGYNATSDLFLYDLRTETWSEGPDLPGLRDHAPIVVLDGALYLVGGYTTTLSTPTAEVWRLDSPVSQWARVADMTTPRGALSAVAVKGRLLAIGGIDTSGVLRSTELYDPEADKWIPGPDLAIPREHLGSAVVGQHVYAIGGRNPQNQTSVEMLVVTRRGVGGEWEPAPDLQFSRGGNAASAAGGVPCAAGGEEAAGTIPSIECLQDGTWVHVADLRVPRHGLAVIGVGRRLHVISGGPQPGAFYSTEHEVLRV
ncbi:MAG: hypothetical protein WD598_08285 [Acidimicrobiia bacterium]